MTFQNGIIAGTLILLCLSASIGTAENVTPYQILEKHYQTIGGLDMLKAQKTVYKEGTITIVDAKLKGTFKQWSEKPIRLRQEVDLAVVKIISGDNGEFSWMVDHNGKIQIQKDEKTLKEREVKKLMELYDNLDPHSENFTLTLEKTEKINGEDCYVIKTTNRINSNIQLDYYRTADVYLVKTVLVQPDDEQNTIYSDFRLVDGTIQPFREAAEMSSTGEKQVFDYTKYAFNIEIDSAWFEPPKQDVKDFQFMSGESAEDVPFEFIEEHIFLPVNINGQERLWVLDCGASVNVIDSSYAVELGLELEGSIKGKASSGLASFCYATLPSYTVRGIRFKPQKVVAMNMRELFHRALGMDVVGILGYDFLSRFITKIDYARERISFYDPNKSVYHGQGKIFDSHLDDEHMFSLPATVDDKYAGKWRLDIGASGLDFHYPYAQEHGMLNRKGVDAIAAGAAGEFNVRNSQFKTIELDGFRIKNPLIGIPHQEGKGAFDEKSLIGNIGNDFLQHFVLYLDYRNQRVILEKGLDFSKEFSRSKSGLQLLYTENNEITIHFVSPNTPAHESGFKAGDIIESINGIDVAYFGGISSIRKLMKEKAGTTYTFKVLRDNELREIKMTLIDLY